MPVDVAATLRLARSPDCPFGDACRHRRRAPPGRQGRQGRHVVLTLDRAMVAAPARPCWPTCPILPSDGLAASLERLVAAGAKGRRPQGARGVHRPHRGGGQRGRVRWRRAARDLCSRRARRRARRTGWRWRVRRSPRPERFADEAGDGRSGRLRQSPCSPPSTPSPTSSADRVRGATPRPSDRRRRRRRHRPPGHGAAAARPRRGAGRHRPLSTGQLRPRRQRRARASRPARPGVPAARARRSSCAIAIEAATALQSGQIDWLPSVAPEVVPVLESDPSLIVGWPAVGRRTGHRLQRPRGPSVCRPERPPGVRPLPRPRRAGRLTPWPIAACPPRPSWRPGPGRRVPPQRSGAPTPRRLGPCSRKPATCVGSDGIYARDDQRLSSEIIIRPGRAELAALMDAVAEALDACGIELRVREVPFSPDVVLPQLEWPNAFDTYLATVHAWASTRPRPRLAGRQPRDDGDRTRAMPTSGAGGTRRPIRCWRPARPR